MNLKVSTFVATSLDGFIARKDGSIDWLSPPDVAFPAGEDCGFSKFLSTVDKIIMGKNTFEQILTFDKWVYDDIPMVVLSSQDFKIPPSLQNQVSASNEAPHKILARLDQKSIKHVYVDGGFTIQSFIRDSLLDELTITVVPIILGEGKPLFCPGKEISLEHISTKTFDFGYVQLKYRLRKRLNQKGG